MSEKAKIFKSIPLTKIFVLFFVILFLNSCAAFKPKNLSQSQDLKKLEKILRKGEAFLSEVP